MFINEVTEGERVLRLPIADSFAYHRWGGVKAGSTYKPWTDKRSTMASACRWTLYHPVDDLDLTESVDLFGSSVGKETYACT